MCCRGNMSTNGNPNPNNQRSACTGRVFAVRNTNKNEITLNKNPLPPIKIGTNAANVALFNSQNEFFRNLKVSANCHCNSMRNVHTSNS